MSRPALLVTGACGFVMAHLVRRWLDERPAERVLALDAQAPDEALERFLAPVRGRVDFLRADVADPGVWETLGPDPDLRRVVHGAAVTSIRRLVHAQGPGRPGLAGARASLHVNLDGTLEVLQWAAALPSLERLVYVSSGSVYGETGPDPLPEDGWVDPADLYAITKHAGELLARWCAGELGLPALSIRLSGVFGPMDRRTPSRDVRCPPMAVVERALAGEVLRVRSLDATGDFVHADDVAAAIGSLLEIDAPRHPVYNVAAGRLDTLADLVDAVRAVVPDLRCEEVGDGDSDVDVDYPAGARPGRFGAYDEARLREETGWRARPIGPAMRDYVEQARALRTARDDPRT